jgi:hypothetical protein
MCASARSTGRALVLANFVKLYIYIVVYSLGLQYRGEAQVPPYGAVHGYWYILPYHIHIMPVPVLINTLRRRAIN